MTKKSTVQSFILSYYRPQGKVMFSQASVILFTIGFMATRSLLIVLCTVGTHASRMPSFLIHRNNYNAWNNIYWPISKMCFSLITSNGPTDLMIELRQIEQMWRYFIQQFGSSSIQNNLFYSQDQGSRTQQVLNEFHGIQWIMTKSKSDLVVKDITHLLTIYYQCY